MARCRFWTLVHQLPPWEPTQNFGTHTDNSKFRNGGYLEWGAKLEGFDKAGVVRCAAKTNGVRTQPSARANQVDMKGGSARKLSCKR